MSGGRVYRLAQNVRSVALKTGLQAVFKTENTSLLGNISRVLFANHAGQRNYTSNVLSGDAIDHLLAPFNKETLTEEKRIRLIKDEEARLAKVNQQSEASQENKGGGNGESQQSKFSSRLSEEKTRGIEAQDTYAQAELEKKSYKGADSKAK